MAVIVQALVSSEAAGVAFTLDPVSGDHGLVVIEGAFGLGEGVVSGMVTPDHFEVRKDGWNIASRVIGPKSVQVVSSPDGGTETQQLPAARAKEPALSDEQAVGLARLACQLEDLWSAPQDIEWAIAGGEIYLLQSRPITTAGSPPPDDPPPAAAPTAVETASPEGWVSEFDTPTSPDTIWTAANVQEVLPDQISPLNLTMTNGIIERFGSEPVERIGIRLKTKDPFNAYFYGRAFLNVSMMLETADQTPFGSAEAIMEQFFGHHRDDFELPPKERTLGRVWRYANVLPRMTWFTIRMKKDIEDAEAIVEEFENDMAARPVEQRSIEELIAAAEDGLTRGGFVAITHVAGGGVTSSAFEWLRRCTETWLDDRDGVLQARLCSGLAAVESAQPAYELWDLSRLVLSSPNLVEAFTPSDPHEIERALRGLQGDEVAPFRSALDGFLARHGHRSIMEAEPAARSWQEDVPTVLAMVRNYLHASEASDPRAVEERQRRDRERATEESLARLNWWQRRIFPSVLKQAQDWVKMREHTKDLMVRSVHRGRLLSREMGRRAVTERAIDDVFDFYFLTWDEAKRLLRGLLQRDEAMTLVARRREEEARNKQVVLPETFAGRPAPLTEEEQAPPQDRVLRGIAVSPGRVTAKARVILDPREDAVIEPGEVLVAPVTDAGWTPLFVAAGAVVVDVGGSLSHGSTVAREYGLPAVVNVKHGTKVIETGQTITVDGTRGIVVLDGAQ
jgi:pyruvate,water dikinase